MMSTRSRQGLDSVRVLSLMGFAAVALPLAVGCASEPDPEPLPPVSDPLDWVDPKIGSGGFGYAYGSAFPGAAAPHGLVKVGPDTRGEFGDVAFLHYSGYYADDDTVLAFTHLHTHGTGLTDYGILGVMPTVAFDPQKIEAADYAARFDKATEVASPGYYATVLETGVSVELTARPHAAHHRYRFSDGQPAQLVIDLARSLPGGEITDAELEVVPEALEVRGRLHSNGDMTGKFGGHELFFVIQAKGTLESYWTWADGPASETVATAAGQAVGAALSFAPGSEVELRVGVSFVSIEGARKNLEAELPDWDFEGAHEATRDEWRTLLSAILVEGGTESTRRAFYSALYRCFLMPTITSDVDGAFIFAGTQGTVEEGRFFSDMSLWDTYRTVHPLYSLIAPDSAADTVRSLVTMAELSGGGFPRWPIATGESGTMLGASADVVIADAVVKGIANIGAADAFDLLYAAATEPGLDPSARGGRHPAEEYIAQGYVTAASGRSVSTTMEFAIDDFALAAMADALGRDQEAGLLRERSLGYRQLYDSELGFFRSRSTSGAFVGADSPNEFQDDYAEATAMQTLWAPLHDIGGLAALLGGEQTLIDRLDEFFVAAADELETNPIEVAMSNFGPRPFYWHGNEPDIHAAYLFGQLGRDDLTQKWVQWITENLYSDTPHGLPGNDDGGTMSAWYVFSALGIYPLAGTDQYFVGTPLFTRMRIRVPGGEVVIEAPSASLSRRGVSGVSVNGVPLSIARIEHSALAAGARIEFSTTRGKASWSESAE